MTMARYLPAATAGTAVLRTTPGVLESVYDIGGSHGKISVYDGAVVGAAGGTPILEWTPSAVDITTGKRVDIPVSSGIVLVLAANTRVTIVANDVARG